MGNIVSTILKSFLLRYAEIWGKWPEIFKPGFKNFLMFVSQQEDVWKFCIRLTNRFTAKSAP